MSDLPYLRNVTTINRNASGNVIGITSPYRQSNTITLDANGYLASITNANGETTSFTYTDKGLLTSAKSPGTATPSLFTYDSKGRLLNGSDPAGGSDTLVRSTITDGFQVQHTTAEGQQTTYGVQFLSTGEQRRVKRCQTCLTCVTSRMET